MIRDAASKPYIPIHAYTTDPVLAKSVIANSNEININQQLEIAKPIMRKAVGVSLRAAESSYTLGRALPESPLAYPQE